MKIILLVSILSLVTACKDQVGTQIGADGSAIVGGNSAVETCATDSTSPIMGAITSVSSNASSTVSTTVKWDTASDNCSIKSYELMIGTTPGGSDILAATNIGDVTEYTASGLSLSYTTNYYTSVKAIDSLGNKSSMVTSSSWTVFDPRTLTDLMTWLDSAQIASIKDNAGNTPNQTGFGGDIQTWSDMSGSTTAHDYTAVSGNRPDWDYTEKAVVFNGSNDLTTTPNSGEINIGLVAQRTIQTVIKTSNDINSRQVIFEEGGGTRGLNIYIFQGELYCGFWNATNDGDGTQAFVSSKTTISQDTKYVVTMLFDYSNYAGASGVDGQIECFVDGASIGTNTTTSRLFSHSGAIGLGGMNNSSRFETGTSSGNGHYYKGHIYEFLMYNTAHSDSSIEKLTNFHKNKWSL